jgi:predicted CopG family antitoxin
VTQKKTIGIRVDESVYNILLEQAQKEDRSISYIARRLLSQKESTSNITPREAQDIFMKAAKKQGLGIAIVPKEITDAYLKLESAKYDEFSGIVIGVLRHVLKY